MFAKKVAPPASVLVAYSVFLGLTAGVWHFVANGEFSAILTMAEMLQCFALVTLAMQVVSSGSAAGISARALVLDAVAICCRLSSTLWLNGYLPVDQTGDWAYQAIEICCLSLVAYLMRCVFVTHRATYQEQHDSLPVKLQNLVIGCFILAVVVHPHLDRRELFDILWTTGCYLETLSMLPQLWMLSKIGEVEALTSHFVVLSALSRVCSLIFWYRGFAELAPPAGGVNFPGVGVVGAHVMQLLLSCDFVFLYLRNFRRTRMALPTSWNV